MAALGTRTEIQRTRVEFRLSGSDAYEDGSVLWVSFMSMLRQAIADMKDRGLVDKDSEPSDDALKVRGDDDGVVIYYVVERREGGEERLAW